MKMRPELGPIGLTVQCMEIHASHTGEVENAQCYMTVHGRSTRVLTTLPHHPQVTTALTFLYCVYSALTHGWCLHYANDAGAHITQKHRTLKAAACEA